MNEHPPAPLEQLFTVVHYPDADATEIRQWFNCTCVELFWMNKDISRFVNGEGLPVYLKGGVVQVFGQKEKI
jgi:hypothetical protein